MARFAVVALVVAVLGFAAFCVASSASGGVYGVDTAGQDVYESGWSCLQDNGFTFGIVRVRPSPLIIICSRTGIEIDRRSQVWHSYGAPDDTAPRMACADPPLSHR